MKRHVLSNLAFIISTYIFSTLTSHAQTESPNSDSLTKKYFNYDLTNPIQTAKIIVRAKVENVTYSTTKFLDKTILPTAYFTFKVINVLKGVVKKEQFVLANIGYGPSPGTLNFTFNDASPFLTKGDDVVLFLVQDGKSSDAFIDKDVLFVNNEKIFTRYSDNVMELPTQLLITASLEKIKDITNRQITDDFAMGLEQTGDLVTRADLPRDAKDLTFERLTNIVNSISPNSQSELIGTTIGAFASVGRVGSKAEPAPRDSSSAGPKE